LSSSGLSGADNRLVPGHTGVLALDVPSRMTALVDGGDDRVPVELMAAVNVKDGFAPTLVATVHGYEGGQAAFTWSVVDGLRRDLTDARIVAVSDWTAPASWDAPEPGRRIDYVHRTGTGVLVAGREFVAVAQGWAIQSTTTAALQTRAIFDALLEEAVGSITIRRPAGRRDTVTRLVGRVPVERGVERLLPVPPTGESGPVSPREDLTSLREQAAWTYPQAVGLRPQTLEILQALDPDRPVFPDVPGLLEDLAGAGLVGEHGLNEDGVFLLDALRASRSSLTATLHARGEESTLSCVLAGDVSVAVWGLSRGQRQYGHPGEATRQRLGVAIVPTAELSAVVCGWLGVGPVWVDEQSPVVAAPQDVEQLVGGRPVPGLFPEGPEIHLWQLATTTDQGVIDEVEYLDAGARGLYTVRGDDEFPDKVLLWPADPAWVLRVLEDRVQAAYFGRPVTLV
jgi:hypothetical protein